MKRTQRFSATTSSDTETLQLGAAIGKQIDRGMCVALVGPLGAGKTTMVRGLCRGLGVKDTVISPTFILYEAFEGRRDVVHIDLYRLEHEIEIEELGVFDLIGTDTVILAEWGERSQSLLSDADAVIEIVHHEGTERAVTLLCTEEAGRVFEEVPLWS